MMRRFTSMLALSVALLGGALTTSAWAQTPVPRTLDISFKDGHVTLIASGVSLMEILNEWQRKGGSTIVGAERLTGAPLTYEFHDVPETTVMASLLRNAAGVIVAPRRLGGPTGASGIEQVLVLPVSRPTTAPAAVVTMPTNQYQNPNPVPIYGQPNDDIPPAVPIQNPSKPAPGPKPATPSNQPSVGSAGTSATPGVVVAPVKPGTPVPAGTIIK